MSLANGTQAVFHYPKEFVTLPDFSAHRGQRVTVIRPLVEGVEYDNEGDPMYQIRAEDGWIGSAWESELEASTERTRGET